MFSVLPCLFRKCDPAATFAVSRAMLKRRKARLIIARPRARVPACRDEG
jgi:hypothetical protein